MAQPAALPGMRIDIDPATGELTGPPSGGTANAVPHGPNPAPGRAGNDLRIVQGPTAEYGISVDLQGRFQSTTRIAIAPTGEAATHCDTSADRAPAAGDQP